MGGHRTTLAFAIPAGMAMVMLGGCTLFTTLDDLSGGPDDTPDSTPCSTCDGASDGTKPVDGGDGSSTTILDGSTNDGDAAQPPTGVFVCGATTVAQCSDCPGAPEPCLTCDNNGNPSPLFCAAAGATCRDVAPAPFGNGCHCGPGNANCSAFQVCHGGGGSGGNNFCHTCGEPQSSGDPCKAGGTCSGTTCM